MLSALVLAATVVLHPSFRCEAYGRLVECRAVDTGEETVEWAAICPQAHPDIYRSTGSRFGFRLMGRTQIEMHLPDVGGFPPLRAWAFWKKDRVVFQQWEEPRE